jgi:sugar-specific transcriptional regulator TrmB
MFTKLTKENLQKALSSLDLPSNAQKVFEVLIEKGPMRAKSISSYSGVKRELTYRALQELEAAGLIKKDDPEGSVALFYAEHPETIIKKLKDSQNNIESLQKILGEHMTSLVGAYNKGIGIPTVEVKEGIEGLRYLYHDIINTRENIYLIRSPLDVQHPEIKTIIQAHRENQKKLGLKTFMITSFTNPSLTLDQVIKRDKEYLVDRHLAPRNLLNIPAQIKIYGEKVAITSFDGQVITTIIENKAIKETFKILFTILWNMGRPVSEILEKRKKDIEELF